MACPRAPDPRTHAGDFHGCPIDRGQLLGLITALLTGRRPDIPGYSVCVQCKLRGTACLLVTGAAPCLGPVTRAGCGALCPAYARACFGSRAQLKTRCPAR